MLIAVPIRDGTFAASFEQSDSFELFQVADDRMAVSSTTQGGLSAGGDPLKRPRLLRDWDVTHLLVDDVTLRELTLLEKFDIEVTLGVIPGEPDQLVHDFLRGRLERRGLQSP